MSTLGNILWFLLGGFVVALMYFAAGIVCCCTIVGIPFAKAHWRLMKMSLLPFGSTINISIPK